MTGEMYPPCEGYRGPVTKLDPVGIYDVDDHCASCGSTDVRIVRPGAKTLTTTIRCSECGRVTKRDPIDLGGKARFSILVGGKTVKRSVPRRELEAALSDVMDGMGGHSERIAREYLGRDYIELSKRYNIDRAFLLIAENLALYDGYVDGLEVGEEYNLPGFPVSVVRTADVRTEPVRKASAKTASKPKASPNRAPAKKSPAKKTASGRRRPCRPRPRGDST